MDVRADSLKARFFADAQDYLSRGKEIAGRLATDGAGSNNSEDVNELFRYVHSIKSEASYLKYEEVGRLAHSLEEELDELRSGKGDEASRNAPEIAGKLDEILRSIRAIESKTDLRPAADSPDFNKFEWKLLKEAGRRGERFYRVVFEIEPDAPMKRARAYLLLSNLEQISTVVRTEPSLTPAAVDTGDKDDDFTTVTIYLTAEVAQSVIYNALDVDQIIRSRVEVLDLQLRGGGENAGGEVDALVSAGSSTGAPGRVSGESASFYRLTGRKLDQLTAYADDLRISLRELELDSDADAGAKDLAESLRKLNRLAGGLYDELSRIRTATLAEEFLRLEEHVDDLALRLGKRVKLVTDGGSHKVDRRILAALSDPLNHLLRNAVDHGIESPEVRRSAGKEETGTISLTAVEDGEKLKITVSDDGLGIDEEALRRELALKGEELEGDLIEILSTPGFTTLAEATDLSGRGVGLDLVARKVEEVGGEIHAAATRGKGAAFEITVPRGTFFARLLFFRFGPKLFALPGLIVSEIRRIAKGELKRNSSGRVFYLGSPAFAGDTPAQVGEQVSYGSYGVVVSYLGRKACILADDVLFEHEVRDDLLAGGSQDRRMAISFGSGKREFIFLQPSAIFPGA